MRRHLLLTLALVLGPLTGAWAASVSKTINIGGKTYTLYYDLSTVKYENIGTFYEARLTKYSDGSVTYEHNWANAISKFLEIADYIPNEVVYKNNSYAVIIKCADPLKAGVDTSGTIYYELNKNKEEATVISGTWQYKGTVIIPAKVEYRGNEYSVTTIGKNAFYCCYDLEQVVLGPNVAIIKGGAFYRCGHAAEKDGNGKVIVPACEVKLNLDSDGLRIIENSGIQETRILPNRGDTLLLGKNIMQLGPTNPADSVNNWYSWGARSGVKFFKVAQGNTYFCNDDKGVLYNSDKSTLIAFPSASSLTSYEIPPQVLTVRQYAFHGLVNLKKVTGGNNVLRIGGVISGSLTSFHVGEKVRYMPTTVFMYCTTYSNKTNITFIPDVDENNKTFDVIDSSLYKYTKDDTILCRCYFGKEMETFVVPANVTQIGSYAFYSHKYLKYIDFQNCTNLKSSNISGTAFHSTSNSVQFLNAENLFVNIDGVYYDEDTTHMILYGENVTMSNYVMPDETEVIPVSAIGKNEYVKTFAINKAAINKTNPSVTALNTEYWYKMSSLERYSVDADNMSYSADTSGVLYNKQQTTLISYPRANPRAYYRVAEGTTQINVKAFYFNKYLKVLDLGNSIKSVMNGNNYTMASMAGLQAIKVSTMVPPTVSTSSFSTEMLQNGTIKLYVPLDTTGGKESAADIYANASVWNRFYIVRDTSKFESDIHDIDVDYKVNHYQQNINDDNYALAETTNMTGKLLCNTAAVAKMDGDFAGFDVQDFVQIPLNNTGMSLNIYYHRKHFTIRWMNGNTIIKDATYRYGASFLQDKPADQTAPSGKHFVGWNTDPNAKNGITFTGNEIVRDNVTYYAIFAANDSKQYEIRHYKQNIDDDEYTLVVTAFGYGSYESLTDVAPYTGSEYDGFSAKPIEQQTIAQDGSTVVNVYYDRNTHSLIWNKNGGNFNEDYTSGNAIKFGTPITAPNATREGYEFRYWNTTDDPNSSVTLEQTMPDNDLTYFAIWKIKQYHATFYLNNGTNEVFIDPEIDFGATITPPPGNPQLNDYDGHHDFKGWSETENGSILTGNNFGVMTTAGAKFYAIWQIHSNKLTWDANGGNALTGNYTSGMVEYDDVIIAPDVPTRTGYTFKGWATTFDGTPEDEVATTMPDDSLTYYAVWEINQHTITWNANGGQLATEGTNGSVNYNTEITPATTADRVGYTFKGWNTTADATTTIEPATTMPDADLTYYAVWQVHQHNLKWYPNGGSFTNSDPSGLVAFGTEVAPPQVDREGWKCGGWGETSTATSNVILTRTFFMPDNDLNYYAIWLPRTNNMVTWKYNDGSDMNFAADTFTTNQPIIAPEGVPGREHYQFIGWAATPDGEVLNDLGIMDEVKKTFYAQWQINSNTLAWDANGGTILSNGTNGTVEFDTPLTPATAERTGYAFKGWALSSTATVNDTVRITTMPDAPTTYYAVWTPKTYQVEWKYNNGTNENFIVTDAIFDAEIEAPNSNPTRDYNDFEGWAATPEGAVLSDYGKLTTEGATFYAKWQLKKFTLAWDANGGELSGEYTQGKVEYGTKIDAPTATLANYIFAGWGTSAKPDSIVNVTTMPASSLTLVANWLANTYVVEWRMNDGTDDNYTATNVDYGNAIIAPADDPERTNYQFLGWMDENGELVDDFGTMQTDHVIFYAQWQKNSHNLTWNANGGQLSGDYTSGNVEVGTEIVRPVAERTGYTFNGWNTYVDAVDSISISTMPDNSIEYFAIWNVNNYVATWYFDADSVFANINLNYADTIKAPSVNPDNNGYTFLGWSATEAGSVIDSFGLMPAADTAFYAVWQKIAEDKKFAILWYRNDGTPAVFITDTLAQGDSIVAPSVNPDRADYKFVGWSVTTDGETIAEFGKIVSDTAFYAVWQIQDTTTPITSTFVATWYMNNGTDSVFTASTFAQGDSIVAPSVNPNRAGYTFLGWSNEISGSLVTNFGTAAADTAFYAVWLKNKCLVLWMFEQDSVFKIDTLFYGDAIIVPEVNPVREQYAFKGWAMSGDSALVDFGTAEGSESLFYAVWEEVVVPQYRAVWYFNDGTNSAFTTTMVTEGAVITAPESNPKRTDYLFKGWAASVDGAVTTSFGTMSANGAAFYAVWEALVSFTAPAIYNTCESGVDHIELTDINNSQITFEWNINGDIDSTQTDGYLEFTDDMALSGTIEVTGILGDTRVTKTISYQRNKEILRTMWDDVITVVNGKGYFESYKWYHNGVLVDTTDMYYEKGGLTGTYYLVVTTVDSVEITSCEMSFGEPEASAITVYPNPVVNSILVEGDNVKAGNTITIIDNDGKVRVAKQISGEGIEEVNVSALPQGIYVVKVGEETVSIIKF